MHDVSTWPLRTDLLLYHVHTYVYNLLIRTPITRNPFCQASKGQIPEEKRESWPGGRRDAIDDFTAARDNGRTPATVCFALKSYVPVYTRRDRDLLLCALLVPTALCLAISAYLPVPALIIR